MHILNWTFYLYQINSIYPLELQEIQKALQVERQTPVIMVAQGNQSSQGLLNLGYPDCVGMVKAKVLPMSLAFQQNFYLRSADQR